ncbi:MAG: TetR family transcriptional regulator C-terminal domain-containing protein [Gammaproteobacteria bacterium]|nr:TetR family transcriptional regulator C-terminal domain-containing protein [Gammaproteobacteria bacterium]
MAANPGKLNRRALSKEVRRRELIDATIKCISKKGLGSTTLADVASEAGLSQGIVNLHFKSKDNLLAETLRSIADEYHEQFMQTLEESAPDPAAQLLALMEMDLKPAICDRKKLAVWFAFLGEVKAVPTYRKICSERNQKYDRIMLDLATDVIRDGGYENVDARAVADVLSSLTDGMWLSCLMNPGIFDRHHALETVRHYLGAVFPGHCKEE